MLALLYHGQTGDTSVLFKEETNMDSEIFMWQCGVSPIGLIHQGRKLFIVFQRVINKRMVARENGREEWI